MGDSKTSISPNSLISLIGTPQCPIIIDVRRKQAFDEASRIIATAQWRDHQKAGSWAEDLAPGTEVVVYCVHGHQVSQSAAAILRACGVQARYLDGGVDDVDTAGGITVRKDALPAPIGITPSRWVIRERPAIDGLAACWLIRRFVDPDAVICFVSPDWVEQVAEEIGAMPLPCSGSKDSQAPGPNGFDALLERFDIRDRALADCAATLRGPENEGISSLIWGLSKLHSDDTTLLEQACVLFDALYASYRAEPETMRDHDAANGS